LTLDALKFGKVISAFQTEHATNYASRYVETLNQESHDNLTDVDTLAHEMEEVINSVFPADSDSDSEHMSEEEKFSDMRPSFQATPLVRVLSMARTVSSSIRCSGSHNGDDPHRTTSWQQQQQQQPPNPPQSPQSMCSGRKTRNGTNKKKRSTFFGKDRASHKAGPRTYRNMVKDLVAKVAPAP